MKGGREAVRPTTHDLARYEGIEVLVKHSDDEALVVDPAAPRTASHLDVFAAGNPPVFLRAAASVSVLLYQ